MLKLNWNCVFRITNASLVHPRYASLNAHKLRVEKYIIANKHLPEMPSAEEISNSEVNLFEMQKLQMKKIEELTLYIIELQKQLNDIKAVTNEK